MWYILDVFDTNEITVEFISKKSRKDGLLKYETCGFVITIKKY